MKVPKTCKGPNPCLLQGLTPVTLYCLLLVPLYSLKQLLCRLGFLAEGLAKNPWVLVYSSERNWLGHFPE